MISYGQLVKLTGPYKHKVSDHFTKIIQPFITKFEHEKVERFHTTYDWSIHDVTKKESYDPPRYAYTFNIPKGTVGLVTQIYIGLDKTTINVKILHPETNSFSGRLNSLLLEKSSMVTPFLNKQEFETHKNAQVEYILKTFSKKLNNFKSIEKIVDAQQKGYITDETSTVVG